MAGSEFLSTTDAAQLAGVAPSSVKRWADLGVLPSSRTAGGHRRFLRRDVERFLSERQQSGTGEQAERWLALMSEADPHPLLGGLYSARGRLGAWHRVADELGPALELLGERWAEGQLTVLQEHLASERLHRALAQVSGSLVVPQEARACLLATAEDDEHTLGLSLAELTLRECGWRTLWAGRRTPLPDMARMVDEGTVALVALSASEHSRDTARLAAQVKKLSTMCRKRGVPLVLGGSGHWPEVSAPATRVTHFSELRALVAALQPGRP